MGRLSFIFKKPRLTFNKSSHGEKGFAFYFREKNTSTVRYNQVKLRFFNAFGEPDQYEVIKKFDKKTGPFAQDVELGSFFKVLKDAKNSDRSIVQVEVSSTLDGMAYQYDFSKKRFLNKVKNV